MPGSGYLYHRAKDPEFAVVFRMIRWKDKAGLRKVKFSGYLLQQWFSNTFSMGKYSKLISPEGFVRKNINRVVNKFHKIWFRHLTLRCLTTQDALNYWYLCKFNPNMFTMTDAILNHRSIRKFKDKPIGESLLGKILTASSRASTTGNMQVYSIVVTKDKSIKERLWEAHFKQNMVT